MSQKRFSTDVPPPAEGSSSRAVPIGVTLVAVIGGFGFAILGAGPPAGAEDATDVAPVVDAAEEEAAEEAAEEEPSAFVLSIEAPEGATVRVGGEPVEDAARIELDGEPEEALEVRVEKDGFTAVTQTVEPSAFAEADGEMRAALTIELEAVRPARRAARPRPAPPAAQPAEEPGAEAQDGLPDNPF